MPVMTLAQQAPDFGEFYVPRFEVHAAGAALPESVVRDVTQVTYHDNIKEIDSFEITVGNWDATEAQVQVHRLRGRRVALARLSRSPAL